MAPFTVTRRKSGRETFHLRRGGSLLHPEALPNHSSFAYPIVFSFSCSIGYKPMPKRIYIVHEVFLKNGVALCTQLF